MWRWNGWGDDTIYLDLPPAGLKLLEQKIGPGHIQGDFPLDKLIACIPASRLRAHPLITTDARVRLQHAHGQSLPDWIGLRRGSLSRFPDGVAQPANTEGLQTLLQFAAQNGIIVIPYGGGTSVVGHLAVPPAQRPVLTVSLQHLNRLLHLNTDNLLATFEAGVCGPELETQLNSHGYTLGHFPQSFEFSSLGGWVATRSSGQQSKHYGRIEQLFAGGEMLTLQGPLCFPPFPESAAGPDLRHVVLGSEGRIGILSKVIVRIKPLPQKDVFYALFFPAWAEAQKAVRSLAASDVSVSMVRLSNPAETKTSLALAGRTQSIKLLKTYLGWRGVNDPDACLCLLGFTGSHSLIRAARRRAFSILRRQGGVFLGQPIGKAWRQNRFRSAYLRNTLWDLGYGVDTLETAVTWDKVTFSMQAIEEALKATAAGWNEHLHVFSHLSHVYPTGSSIYTTFVFRLAPDPEKLLERWSHLKEAASRAIIACGGTISHQHGVGNDHRRFLAAEKGALGIETLQHIFNFFDPGQQMNPSKLLPPEADK